MSCNITLQSCCPITTENEDMPTVLITHVLARKRANDRLGFAIYLYSRVNCVVKHVHQIQYILRLSITLRKTSMDL